ncbi:MAG: ParB N-terminal domain-containing protein [Clostridia bacterium]|nr:ParB N-terminal domain-containing protein [Clostridia bacterium]
MGLAKKFNQIRVVELIPYKRNAKQHSDEQILRLMESIKEFGFISPVLIDEKNRIIAGHGRIEAAKRLGITEVPCVYIEGLTEAQRKAYILADNRLTELGEWDMDLVSEELKLLDEEGFDVELTGFDITFDDDELDDNGEKGEGHGEGDEETHSLIIDSMVIELSASEYHSLMDVLHEYVETYGTTDGFVDKLINGSKR